MITTSNFSAGHYEENSGYKYFVPNKINDVWHWNNPEINTILERAAIRLGELNSFSKLVPNIDIFIKMHATKEAVISSRIEGTRTQMSEALMPIEEIDDERRDDWIEVNNYVKAMNFAINELEKLPISSRLIRNTHKMLLSNARGKYKMPGEYRTSQNWIGGASIADAHYIPPHHSLLNNLMSDLENFINSESPTPDLIKIAIIHYQFETIHPFLDGNGRVGRLLITLFLIEKKILDKPLLYLSAFFDKNRNLYYDNLANVKQTNNIEQWLKFFLVGIEQTAQNAVNTLAEVIKYKQETEEQINLNFGRRASNALAVFKSLLVNPSADIGTIMKISGLSYKSANDLVKMFVKNGILNEITGKNRNRYYRMEKYFNLFSKE